MSQTASTRPPRSFAGMAGALIVVVLLVVAWVGFRASDDEPTPIRTVDWTPWVKAGRAEARLLLFAPGALPEGWRARSVRYAGGSQPSWRLGMLTDVGKYVGIEESLDSGESLVEQYIDEDAVRGEDVTVAGETWQSWSDAGGDYALVRSIEVDGRPYESVLVGGSAAPSAIRDFVATLEVGELRLTG